MLNTNHSESVVGPENDDSRPGRRYEAKPEVGKTPSMPELTRVLRWSGGIVLAAAAIAFMCQGVYSLMPMTRHWIMLGICGLLGLLGSFTGTVLKEEKGARAFLGFAAGSFPVLASQLGAMFFSLFGKPPAGMPRPLIFSLLTSAQVASVTALTLAIAMPVSYLAFSVLARPRARLLTGIFTLANLCILLPVRESLWTAAIITALACGLYWVDSVRLRKDFRLAGFEGRMARLMLAAPPGVMMGRAFFYPHGPVFDGILLALASTYVAYHLGRVVRQAGVRKLCRVAGLIGLGTSWLICVPPILNSISLGTGAAVYLILLPMAAILGVHSVLADDRASIGYRAAAASLALLSIVVAHGVGAAAMVSTVGIIVALATVTAGTLAGEKSVFVLGCVTAIISLGNLGLAAVRLHGSYAWVALALIGIVVIFSASLLEKGLARRVFKEAALWGRLKIKTI